MRDNSETDNSGEISYGKNDSISYRLATLATGEIKEIEIGRSKNGLKINLKKCFLIDYNTQCRIRNCFICSQQ